MSPPQDPALQYAHKNRDRFLAELKEFLTIPSISTDPSHAPDLRRAAEWVGARLDSIGMKVRINSQDDAPPIVYAESRRVENAPSILVYGHYDVQPAEPLEQWESGPFEPTQRGDNLFARGASDMKGQLMAALKAAEAISVTSRLPINVKFMVEGEEEIGSPHLAEYITKNHNVLACDFSLNPDAGMIDPEIPTITYALRGLCYFELRVEGPDHDLHSGAFGGVVLNPAQALCELLAGLHETNGKVALPGFYDKVRPLSSEERRELSRLQLDEEFYLKQTGAKALWGEMNYSPVERVGARPTLEINGVLSGFTGAGSKTVIPAYAMAKISTRLVNDQDPKVVEHQLRQYFEKHAPKSVRWELNRLYGYPGSAIDPNMPAVRALSRAFESVWNKPAVFKREGISVPVVAHLEQILGVHSILTGFSLPDDRPHSPNEKLNLPTWYRGIDALIHFIFNLAA